MYIIIKQMFSRVPKERLIKNNYFDEHFYCILDRQDIKSKKN